MITTVKCFFIFADVMNKPLSVSASFSLFKDFKVSFCISTICSAVGGFGEDVLGPTISTFGGKMVTIVFLPSDNCAVQKKYLLTSHCLYSRRLNSCRPSNIRGLGKFSRNYEKVVTSKRNIIQSFSLFKLLV